MFSNWGNLWSEMEGASTQPGTPDIRIERRAYDESVPLLATRRFADSSENKGYLQAIKTKASSVSCSKDSFCQWLVDLFPIIRWLPKYSIKRDLVADISGGLTVGIMHIPQGKAICLSLFSESFFICSKSVLKRCSFSAFFLRFNYEKYCNNFNNLLMIKFTYPHKRSKINITTRDQYQLSHHIFCSLSQ